MKYLSILFGGLFILSSCVKNNPEPVWLELNKWTLEVNPVATDDAGQLTQNLSDAWVYVDNKLIGCFELPCKIPVLVSGQNIRVQIYPTIRNNGIAATKKIYPFVEPIDVNVDLEAGQTYTPDMKTRYKSNVKFPFIEDFSSPSQIKLDESDDAISTAVFELGNDDNYALNPGNDYGHIIFTSANALYEAQSTDELYLPDGGAEVYLEIDYRNTNSLLTGLVQYGDTYKVHPNVSLNAQDPSEWKWKKIYIDMREIASYATNVDFFKLYFKGQIDDGKSASDIYIDNIKVVHF